MTLACLILLLLKMLVLVKPVLLPMPLLVMSVIMTPNLVSFFFYSFLLLFIIFLETPIIVSHTTASGPGLEPGVTVDVPTYFLIHPLDSLSFPPTSPLSTSFTVSFSPLTTQNVSIAWIGGKYNVSYLPSSTGEISISVELAELGPIYGSPFSVVIRKSLLPLLSSFLIYSLFSYSSIFYSASSYSHHNK